METDLKRTALVRRPAAALADGIVTFTERQALDLGLDVATITDPAALTAAMSSRSASALSVRIR